MDIEMEKIFRYAIAYTIKKWQESEDITEKEHWKEERRKIFNARKEIKKGE